MKVIGVIHAVELSRNGKRNEVKLLVSDPTDLISITLDEGSDIDRSLVGQAVSVGVSVGSYRDKPQYYLYGQPRALKDQKGG